MNKPPCETSMLILFAERASASPHVSRVWRACSRQGGDFLSVAYPQWEIVVSRSEAGTNVIIRGPETIASKARVPADGQWVGIRFRTGVTMPSLPVHRLAGSGLTLPSAGGNGFWLNGAIWEAPAFDNADDFVDRLVRAELLVQDPLIEKFQRGESLRADVRTIQRRFVRSTGLTRKTIQTIERAHSAVNMMRNGVPIHDTVATLGFSDQPHLTRSLRRLIGITPAQLVSKNPVQLSFIPSA